MAVIPGIILTNSTPLLKAGLISFFCVVFHLASSQSSASIDSLLRKAADVRYQNFPRADSIYQLASDQLAQEGIDKNTVLWIHVLHQRALTALFHDKLTDAKNYLVASYESIDVYADELHPKRDSLTNETRLMEASYFYVISNYSAALNNLGQAEAYLMKSELNENACRALYGILQFQATIYQLQGEFESCIDRYLASIKYYDCHRDRKNFPNYVLAYRNIGLAYMRMSNMSKARSYFFDAKANLDSCPESSKTFIIRNHALVLYNSLAEFYIKEQKYDSAKYMYELATPFLQDNPNHLARRDELLARVAQSEKKFDIALSHFSKALSRRIQIHGEKNFNTSHVYEMISQLYEEIGDKKNALLNIQKALNSLVTEDIDVNDYNSNPSISTAFLPKIAVVVLNKKANLLAKFYYQQNSSEFLNAAQRTNQLAIQLLDSTRHQFSLEKDKVVLGDEAVKVYETSMGLLSQLFLQTKDENLLESCLALMDKSKGAVLMDHLKLVRNFSGIPKNLLDRERQLQAEISSAEQRLYRAEITRAETSGHREELGRIKKDYTVLLNDIKESWPEYYRLRTASEPLTITGIKRSLQVDQALLEYFVGDSVLYMIGVTQDSAMLHVSPADSLRDQIERLRSIIAARDKFSDPTLISEWNKTCQALFKRLIHPLTPLLKNSSRLIIISDDALNYLPFEMLIDSSGKLLLSKFSISYAASESLRREQTAMKSTGNFFGGFNADYSNHPEFPALPGASNEVNIIRDIFGFRSTAFTAATADDFRRQASRFKILHLALHSQINDEKPLFSRLVFTRAGDLEDSDITANELYSMKLNAEIVVLSACETGLGKLQRGEGMMSLSRAFMYAGVPSAVISMWKVPDQTTSILMTKFYLELKNGKQKDEALRNAKLQLIKEHPEMSHPYFWAGFIINGKTDAIDLPMFSNAEWTGISIVTFIFTITILYRFRRKFYFNLLTSSRARVE